MKKTKERTNRMKRKRNHSKQSKNSKTRNNMRTGKKRHKIN